MLKFSYFCLKMLFVSVILFSCKTKKTGCEAYGENGGVKKTTEQSR